MEIYREVDKNRRDIDEINQSQYNIKYGDNTINLGKIIIDAKIKNIRIESRETNSFIVGNQKQGLGSKLGDNRKEWKKVTDADVVKDKTNQYLAKKIIEDYDNTETNIKETEVNNTKNRKHINLLEKIIYSDDGLILGYPENGLGSKLGDNRKEKQKATSRSKFYSTDLEIEDNNKIVIKDSDGDIIAEAEDNIKYDAKKEYMFIVEYSLDIFASDGEISEETTRNTLVKNYTSKNQTVSTYDKFIFSSDSDISTKILEKDAIKNKKQNKIDIIGIIKKSEPANQPVDINKIGIKNKNNKLMYQQETPAETKNQDETLIYDITIQII